jgi:hypothetical protein
MTDHVVEALIGGAVAIINGGITTIAVSYLQRGNKATHDLVNSKMAQLVSTSRELGNAEGQKTQLEKGVKLP